MRRVFVIVLGLLLLAPALTYGTNAQEDACAVQVAQITSQSLQACEDLPHDHACAAGRVIPLDTIQSLSSPAFDGEAGIYGVTLINTSATLPRMTGHQGVVYLLLGDVSLENRVALDTAFTPADPVVVTTVTGANLRTRPSTSDTIITSVNWNTELMADGLSADREWLRVVFDGNPAWISRPLVNGDGLDALPVIDPDSRALMQEFSLQTGRQTDCDSAPNLLLVQGLDLQPVSLWVNQAEIRFRGTITLRSEIRRFVDFYEDPLWFRDFETLVHDSAPEMDALCQFTELAVIDGDSYLNNGLFSIPRGQRAFAFDCDLEGDAPVLWDRALPIPPSQLQALTVLESVSEQALRNPVNVPTSQEIARTMAQIASASGSQSTTTSSAPPNENNHPVQQPASCPGFVPTSPVSSIPFGYVRFYWDPAVGASHYQVNLYNYAEELVISFATQGPETNVRVDTMSPRFSLHNNRTPPMSYEIVAFQRNDVLCTTPRLYLLRDYDPDPDCPQDQWFAGTCEDVIANDP